MYYFSITKQSKADLDFTKEGRSIDEKSLIKILEKEGYCYLANLNLLILRSEAYIQQVFGKAKFDETYFRYLVETQREGLFYSPLEESALSGKKKGRKGGATHHKSKKGLFRVLIDPT